MNNGVSKTEFNKMTMFEVEYYCEGMIHKREREINDALYLAYEESKLTSLAVWGSKDFPKEVPTIRLTPKTKEEVLEEIYKLGDSLVAFAQGDEIKEEVIDSGKEG